MTTGMRMMSKFAYGVDLGWASQLLELGFSWVDDEGNRTGPIEEAKKNGANAVRLRVFVNPPSDAFWMKRKDERVMLGYCDVLRVLEFSKRVSALKMDLMLDFHYSDHFADPEIQDIPKEWEGLTLNDLEERVYTHTRQTLLLFKENGITPKWVQIGNEINHGIMVPAGGLKENPKGLVRLLNSGYEAVKDVFCDCLVITHLAEMNKTDECDAFFDNFFENGGKTDILGFSYYPYWYGCVDDEKQTYEWLLRYHRKYGKPVLIAEIGGDDENEEECFKLLKNTINALKAIPEENGLGIFYWEPEVNRDILPDRYPLGASRLKGEKTLQYTKALKAYDTDPVCL